jgi:hypothetical protein
MKKGNPLFIDQTSLPRIKLPDRELLKERRHLLHQRTDVGLESYADSLDDHFARLADHYARSGNPTRWWSIA